MNIGSVLGSVAGEAKNLAEGWGTRATGNIEKAYIMLYDYRFMDGKEVKIDELADGAKKFSISGVRPNSVLEETLEKEQLGKRKNPEAIVKALNNMMLGEDNKDVPKRKFIVKFNPSTLNLQGYGGGKQSITNFDEAEDGGGGVTYGKLDARVQLGVQLIFDTTRNFDFTKKVADAAMGSLANSVKSVQDKFPNAGKETIETSVRMQVEGFVGALRNPRTRVIEFCWGKMKYRGTLSTLQIRYTMFSPEGYPVRATVQFGMTLVDEKVYNGNMGWWKEKVDKTFGNEPENYLSDNVSMSQHVNSLFNLGL